MKNLSALAAALAVAVGTSFAVAPLADAATTHMQKPAAACTATKSKPCPVKHVSKKPSHKKMHKTAKKLPAKAAVKS